MFPCLNASQKVIVLLSVWINTAALLPQSVAHRFYGPHIYFGELALGILSKLDKQMIFFIAHSLLLFNQEVNKIV